MAETPQNSPDSSREVLNAGKNVLKNEGDINGQLKDRLKNLEKIIKAHDDINAKIKVSDLGLDTPIENIVAITRNTWTTKAKAKDILARAKASPVGKVAEDLKDVELVIASRGGVKDPAARGPKAKKTEARVLPAYKLTNEQVVEVKKVVVVHF